jgi:glycosyltransferase involved in cell wall biosynthesis
MKILFVQHLYFINGTGGTEKICSFLANSFAQNGHQVEIATNENVSGKAIFKLDDQVTVTNIYNANLHQRELIPIVNYEGRNPFLWVTCKMRKKYAKAYNALLRRSMKDEENLFSYNLAHRAKAWKNYIDKVKPDLIITMSIGSLLEITYGNNLDVPIIDSVNGRPDYDFTNILGGRKPFEVRLLEESFQNLAGIQILFDSYRNYLPSSFKGEVVVIPNAVSKNLYQVDHFESKERYKIIHIARLDTGCKQQHLAIDCFSRLSNKYMNWDFELWGVGPDWNRLEKQILDLKMKNRIFLKGFTESPIGKMSEADVFIFPSKYEGFGLALVEAMSVGLPCLGFKSCSGVNELIKHQETGFLAEDMDEMTTLLGKLMGDTHLRDHLGKNAKKAVEVFSESKVLDIWNEFVTKIENLSK